MNGASDDGGKPLGEQGEELDTEAAERASQMTIPGTSRRLSLEAGGAEPDSSSCKLQGGSIGIAGEFDKGEWVTLRVKARVSKVEFVDSYDKETGTIVGTERRHVFRTMTVMALDDEGNPIV